jgi:hypothetical protein
MIPLFVLPYTQLVVLTSSTSGDQHYVKSLHFTNHHLIKIGDEQERLRFARDDKEPGPSWGKQLPGERPRETAET